MGESNCHLDQQNEYINEHFLTVFYYSKFLKLKIIIVIKSILWATTLFIWTWISKPAKAKGHLIHQARMFYDIYFPSHLCFTASFFGVQAFYRRFANPHTILANTKVTHKYTFTHIHIWVNCKYRNPKQTQPPGFNDCTNVEYIKIHIIKTICMCFLPYMLPNPSFSCK